NRPSQTPLESCLCTPFLRTSLDSEGVEARASLPAGTLILDHREAGLGPAAPAAVHRDHVAVAHLLQIVRSEGRTVAAAAIEDDFGVLVRDGFFDIALNHAFAQVDRTGNVAAGPLVVLARVYDDHFFSGVELLLDLAVVFFLDARLRVFHKLHKSFRMIRHRFTS